MKIVENGSLDRDGLRVGAIGNGHEFIKRNGYAVADMIEPHTMTQEAADLIKQHGRTTTVQEQSWWIHALTGHDASRMEGHWLNESHFIPVILMAHGMAAIVEGDYTEDREIMWPKFLKILKNNENNGYKHLIDHYEPVLKAWVAKPSQVLEALPGSFLGSFKWGYSEFNGPQVAETSQGNESLSLPFYGSQMSILMDVHGAEAKLEGRLRSGSATTVVTPDEGYQWVRLSFGKHDYHEVEVIFDRAGITIADFCFDNPQPWFK